MCFSTWISPLSPYSEYVIKEFVTRCFSVLDCIPSSYFVWKFSAGVGISYASSDSTGVALVV